MHRLLASLVHLQQPEQLSSNRQVLVADLYKRHYNLKIFLQEDPVRNTTGLFVDAWAL